MSQESDTTDAITVYSDYVCPFCYLGRESLRRYQDQRDQPLRVDWHPFDLQGDRRNPDGSIDESIEDNKDEDYYEQARANVQRLADQYDVEMDLELAREVDSLDAQVASYHLKEMYDYETWLAFDESLLAALWEEGRDISDHDVLVELAEAVGVDGDEIRTVVADENLKKALKGKFTDAQQRGITGVPTFTYDGYAARGAVPPEQLERLVEGT